MFTDRMRMYHYRSPNEVFKLCMAADCSESLNKRKNKNTQPKGVELFEKHRALCKLASESTSDSDSTIIQHLDISELQHYWQGYAPDWYFLKSSRNDERPWSVPSLRKTGVRNTFSGSVFASSCGRRNRDSPRGILGSSDEAAVEDRVSADHPAPCLKRVRPL